jgi:hypothetical protein
MIFLINSNLDLKKKNKHSIFFDLEIIQINDAQTT